MQLPRNEGNSLPLFISTLLNDAACYPHAVTHVELIETHISWVLLTGEIAYKIKKPVDLGFLDFSSLAKRKQACDDELRLNRRLAPDTYLAVAPITGSADMPRIAGAGEAFEYAVKMRQFPPGDTLDRLSERGMLNAAQIDTLAARLARFHHSECATVPPDSSYGDPAAIRLPVQDNFRILSERLHTPEQLRRLGALQDWSLAEHRRLAPLMAARKQSGMVRECHGDLHLGNLAWVDHQLIIFDCIEFSAMLRWIDVISEVAFCFMDLLHRKHRSLAFRFLNAWLESSGDYRGLALLRYYAVYRALVRAKVAALRAEQASGEAHEIDGCLMLAEDLTAFAQPQLWITHGFSGCGKTTLSLSRLQEQGMVRIRSDIERKRLAGIAPDASSASGIASGLYSRDASLRTYTHMAGLADILLDEGWSVIVDAAFLSRWQRDLLRSIAARHALPFHILDIQADPATLRERILHRASEGKDASEADLRVLLHQIETAEPFTPEETADVTIVRSDPADTL